jgi:hypothetical protein
MKSIIFDFIIILVIPIIITEFWFFLWFDLGFRCAVAFPFSTNNLDGEEAYDAIYLNMLTFSIFFVIIFLGIRNLIRLLLKNK